MIFLNNFKTNASNIGLYLEKNSPTLLTIGGSVFILAGTILACERTIKAVGIIEEHNVAKEAIEEAKELLDTMEDDDTINYSLEDYKRDTIANTLNTVRRLIANYAVPTMAIMIGFGMIFESDRKANTKLADMTGAYISSKQVEKLLKKGITEKYGKDVWDELRYGIKKEIITVEEEDPETGKKKKVKKEIKVADFDPEDPTTYSKFAKFFDESCAEWDKNPEMNLLYLLSMQNTANEMLKCRGHLFLNEVYDMLGIPRTKDGQKYGWIYCNDNPCGDNYVDFGIYELNRPKNRDFVNGYENVILLDFNVDGPIVDLI